PPGAVINPLTGLVTWRTGEGNGPSTNTLAVVVTDNGSPALSATGFVTIVVNEVNSAPSLLPIPDQRVNEGTLLTFTVSASDPDLPTNTLFFTLGQAPHGAAIGLLSGRFSWTLAPSQGPTTNLIPIIVTDSGMPPLSATQTVRIVVRDAQGDF